MRSRIQGLVWLLLIGAVLQPARAGLCDADLNHDGIVNTLDLGVLLSSWTLPPARACSGAACSADINGDGAVNTLDLGQLLAAWDADCSTSPLPRVVITPVAHFGDPAPGIDWPNAYYGNLLAPQIDAEGNVLFECFLGGTGLGELGNLAAFYGQPGHITKLVWETDHAPHFPPGVFIKDLFFADIRLSEAGIVSFAGILQGPGITAHVNDMAIFVGDPRIPGDIRPILQTGDPAPGLEPGFTVRDDPNYTFFNSEQSDNGTLLVFARLAGPGVTPANDYAFWSGTRDNLQLIWRNGIHAPGTPPGVTFTWPDYFNVNDSGVMGFRGMLAGPGIVDGISDRGQWRAGPGALQVSSWTSVPIPPLPPGSIFSYAFQAITCNNAFGDLVAQGYAEGPGTTSDNDMVVCVDRPEGMVLVAREGDPVVEAGPGVSMDTFGNPHLNARREILFRSRLRGPSIAGQDVFAAFFGPYDKPTLTMLTGAPAPNMPAGVLLDGVQFVSGWAAMNDVGDIITVTKISGAGVTPDTDVVLWLYDGTRGEWLPLLRGGDQINGQTMAIFEPVDLLGNYWQGTGGSDGWGLSFNDAGQLALRLEFTDMHGPIPDQGIYIIQTEPSARPLR